MYVCMYIFTYIHIYRESNHGEKNYILEKYFRLTSLSIYCIYIFLIPLHKIFFAIFAINFKQKVEILWEKNL